MLLLSPVQGVSIARLNTRHHHIVSGRALLAADVFGDGHLRCLLHAAACDKRMWCEQMEGVGLTRSPTPVYPSEIDALLTLQKDAERSGAFGRVSAIKAHLWLDGPLQPEGRVTGEPAGCSLT